MDGSDLPTVSGMRLIRWIGNNPPRRVPHVRRVVPILPASKRASIKSEYEDLGVGWDDNANVVEADGWSVSADVVDVPMPISGSVVLGDVTDEKGNSTGQK